MTTIGTEHHLAAPLELPRHQQAVLAAVRDGLSTSSPVTAEQLGALCAFLEERLPANPGRGDGPVRIGRYEWLHALECPARAKPEPFQWDVAKASRRLGLGALTRMHQARQRYPDALEAVSGAIDREIRDDTSLGDWLSDLGTSEIAAVSCHVAAWTARHWLAVPWSCFERVQFGARSTRYSPPPSHGGVSIQYRLDAAIFVTGPPSTERIMVAFGSSRHSRALRLDVLLLTLQVQRAPLRIVTVDSTSGEVSSADVDQEMLMSSARDLLTVVADLVDLKTISKTREIPGQYCAYCWRLFQCGTGRGWVSAHARRVAGIPLGTAQLAEDRR